MSAVYSANGVGEVWIEFQVLEDFQRCGTICVRQLDILRINGGSGKCVENMFKIPAKQLESISGARRDDLL